MSLNRKLHEHCQGQLNERRAAIEAAIAGVMESMEQEGKSTAGDKHHTARASMQLERERLGKSLEQLERLQFALDRTPVEGGSDRVRLGSLVSTSSGQFYVAIPCEAYLEDGQIVHCMGPDSPLAGALLGKVVGQTYRLGDRLFEIIRVE